MRAVGIIPARFASTRLPGKPLVDINGKPMVERVWAAAKTASSLSEVYIAADSIEVLQAARAFGAKTVMTPPELPSGTDRVHYCLNAAGEEADIVVNIQGDEPLIPGSLIDSLVAGLSESSADVATPIKVITSRDDIWDPNTVKVALASDSTALYFSRTAIPFLRDEMFDDWQEYHTFFKHIGIYAYRRQALERFTRLPQSSLEKAEKLEQLRLLQDGARFLCLQTETFLIGVDTPEDVRKVSDYLAGII